MEFAWSKYKFSLDYYYFNIYWNAPVAFPIFPPLIKYVLPACCKEVFSG